MSGYWENKKSVHLSDLAFQTNYLLWLQRHDVMPKETNPAGPKPQNQREKLCSSLKLDINDVRSGSSSRPSAFTRNTSGRPALAEAHISSQLSHASSDELSSLIASLDVLSTMENAAECRMCLLKTTRRRNGPSSQKKWEKCSSAFGMPIINSCRYALGSETTYQSEETFDPGTAPIPAVLFGRQIIPDHPT